MKCPTCQGKGIQTVRVETYSKGERIEEPSFDIECGDCFGVGEVTPVKAKAIKTISEAWCMCNPGTVPAAWTFYADNTHTGCITKHHWHCEHCGKITQVG